MSMLKDPFLEDLTQSSHQRPGNDTRKEANWQMSGDDSRVKALEEREKKLVEWEEHLCKEEEERESGWAIKLNEIFRREEDLRKREIVVEQKESDLGSLSRELKQKELVLDEREAEMECRTATRVDEMERSMTARLDDLHEAFNAKMQVLMQWEERLRQEEFELRTREVRRKEGHWGRES